MATTNASLAADVLDGLIDAGVEFAFLHGEQEAAAGVVKSDIDLVVANKPTSVLAVARPCLERIGVRPFVLWDYDLGHTSTVFLATADASEGVQLDLMCDPKGHGKYGARTGAMLESRVAGVRWPAVGHLHRLAYLVRKRQVKQDHERLQALLVEIRSFPAQEVGAVLRESFAPQIAGNLAEIISGRATGGSAPYSSSYRVRDMVRKAGRLRRPAGFWVEMAGDPHSDLLDTVAGRFGRILPMVATGFRPPGFLSQVEWLRTEVAPVRWRAGLFVSGGAGWPSGDLRVEKSEDLDGICSRVVRAMSQRISG